MSTERRKREERKERLTRAVGGKKSAVRHSARAAAGLELTVTVTGIVENCHLKY